MTELFLEVMNRSISASWLVGAVLLARVLLKRCPRWVTMLLWAMVAVRLVCPALPESPVSLVPSAQTIAPEIMLDWSPQIDTGIPVLNEAVNPVIAESFAPEPAASANPLQILIPVAAAVWILGMGVMGLYTLGSYWLLQRKLRIATVLRYNIYQSEYVPTPFVLGIWKPRVYLPYTMSQENILYVIAHEKAHIRRRDHWWKPLGFFLLTVHWFNPVMWLAYRVFCKDLELACDEAVIRNMNHQQRADYAGALLACSVRPSMAACPLAFGEVGVKTRIKSVMDYRKPALWIVLAAVLLCLAVAVCFLTNPRTEAVSAETTLPTEEAEPVESAPNAAPMETESVVTEAAAPVHQEVADLAYFMELSAFEKEFREMSPERKAQILPEYGGLLDGYDLIARESTDGALSYIVGYWAGAAEENPLYHLRSASRGDGNRERQVLYDLRELEAAEKYEEPEEKYVIYNSYINHSSETGWFLIHPTDSGWGFNDVFNQYLRPKGREYLLDAFSRGIALSTPEGPYLEVYLISETWGEITERIPLTEEQAAQILSEPREKLDAGHGFAAGLTLGPNSSINTEEDAVYFTEARGVPQTALDLAVEKCGYRFATPKDIQSGIVEAKLECSWLDEPIYADQADLQKLQGILTGAEFGYVGGCGYGAKLTVRMEDGTELVMFKGTDGCDSAVFGSYGGYFLGDAQTRDFWDIFGVDIEAAWG